MESEYLKTLWLLRFNKLKKNEEDSAWAYQELYDRCLIHLGPQEEILQLLKQLVQEERMHERLAEELIQLCLATPPELEI